MATTFTLTFVVLVGLTGLWGLYQVLLAVGRFRIVRVQPVTLQPVAPQPASTLQVATITSTPRAEAPASSLSPAEEATLRHRFGLKRHEPLPAWVSAVEEISR